MSRDRVTWFSVSAVRLSTCVLSSRCAAVHRTGMPSQKTDHQDVGDEEGAVGVRYQRRDHQRGEGEFGPRLAFLRKIASASMVING